MVYKWPLLFKINKCRVIHYGNNNVHVHSYLMDDILLLNIKGIKDLGITFEAEV